MSISQGLLKQAEEFKLLAEQANDYDIAKATAVATLAEEGLQKVAAEQVVSQYMEPFNASIAANGFEHAAKIMEKVAAYIQDLEGQLAEYENLVIPEEKADSLQKIAQVNGISEDEFAALKDLPTPLLEKLASNQSDNPWELGSGRGHPKEGTDAILDFINA